MYERTSSWPSKRAVRPGIEVYHEQIRTLCIAGALLLFVLLMLLIWVYGWLNSGGVLLLPTILLILCLLLLAPVGSLLAYLALMSPPHLVIDQVGIQINSPLINRDVIRWPEISMIGVDSTQSGDVFSLVVYTPSELISRQNPVQRLYMRLVYQTTGAVFRLPWLFSTVPPAELLEQIQRRYGRALEHYGVTIYSG
jgi:hypothetical protein